MNLTDNELKLIKALQNKMIESCGGKFKEEIEKTVIKMYLNEGIQAIKEEVLYTYRLTQNEIDNAFDI